MITIYGKQGCPQCDQAKRFCEQAGQEYKYLTLGADYQREEFIQQMQNEYGVTPRTMPQIVQDGVYIGSFQELKAYLS